MRENEPDLFGGFIFQNSPFFHRGNNEAEEYRLVMHPSKKPIMNPLIL